MKKVLAILFVWMMLCTSAMAEVYLSQPPEEGWTEDVLRITAIPVGEGDALLLECGGERMMVDGGPSALFHQLTGALEARGIRIGTHVARCAGVRDVPFTDYETQIEELNQKVFAVLDSEKGEEMQAAILRAAEAGDSVGGVLETVVTGLPAGIGEPWFDTLESLLAHALFSIPAVKGVEFGDGFALADLRGSEANDPFALQDGRTVTRTNRNGGINGGISNGMPVLFRCAVKPTPSISLPQDSVDADGIRSEKLTLTGRHDPAIVHRARVVTDSVTALVLCDALALRYGTDWLKAEEA